MLELKIVDIWVLAPQPWLPQWLVYWGQVAARRWTVPLHPPWPPVNNEHRAGQAASRLQFYDRIANRTQPNSFLAYA